MHSIEPIAGGRFPDAGEARHVGPAGLNVNVALPYSEAGHGDASFLLALDAVLLPIARQFAPTLVLVAAGFDGAAGTRQPTDTHARPCAEPSRRLGLCVFRTNHHSLIRGQEPTVPLTDPTILLSQDLPRL